MKKILAFALSFIVISGMIIAGRIETFSSSDGEGFYYNDRYGELAITGYYGNDPNPEIPSYIGGKKVGFIEDSAFRGNTKIAGVTIPDTIWGIGMFAFMDCTNLKSLYLPENVSYVGWKAFCNCTSLKSITVKDGAGLNSQAFEGCTALINIDISFPNGGDIGGGLFAGCTSLKEISIPKCEYIGTSAFENCSSLSKINLPNGLTTIGDDAFKNCSSLSSVNIPDSVTRIGSGAFENCSKLSSIHIPSGAVEIGGNILLNTPVYKNAANWYGGGFYYDGCLLNVGENIGKAFTVKDGTRLIAGDVFKDNKTVEMITLPIGLKYLGQSAFENCTSLNEIDLSDSLQVIGWSTFENCSSISEILIPEGLKEIGYSAFAGCKSLEYIAIPLSVEKMGDTVFDNSGIKDIYCEVSEEPRGWNYYWCYTLVGYDDENFDYEHYDPESGGPDSIYEKINATIHWGDGQIPQKNASRLSELRDEDFLAFSIVAYETPKAGKSVESLLNEKWNKQYSCTDFKYSEICSNIAGWVIDSYEDTSDETGFTGVVFKNNDGEYVISFRGSNGGHWGPLGVFYSDNRNDWWKNDLPMYFGSIGNQLPQAIKFYNDVRSKCSSDNIMLTGHSLGGGLADAVSAYSGSYAVTFNAAPFLSAAYGYMENIMGVEFRGIDKWNFRDHVNKDDSFVGMWQNEYKNCLFHENNGYKQNEMFQPHMLYSFIKKRSGENSVFSLTEVLSASNTVDNVRSLTAFPTIKEKLYLGTSSDDQFISKWWSYSFFGGEGNDVLAGAVLQHTFVGGQGNDYLIGGRGDDIYYYYKGDGLDVIFDSGGYDELHLLNFDKEDTITLWTDDYYVTVICNDEPIIKLVKDRSKYLSRFKVFGSDSNEELLLLDNWFNHNINFNFSWRVACPVDVDIIDSNGNIVYTVPSEPGIYPDSSGVYTVYNIDGEPIREFMLKDGYSPVVRGAGEGTMDVYLTSFDSDGEMTIVGATDVKVTSDFIASFDIEAGQLGTMLVGASKDPVPFSKLNAIINITTNNENISSYYEPVNVAVNEVLLLQAITDPYMEFTGWYDGNDLISSDASFEYVVKGDADIQAVYREKDFSAYINNGNKSSGFSSALVILIASLILIVCITIFIIAVVVNKKKKAVEKSR